MEKELLHDIDKWDYIRIVQRDIIVGPAMVTISINNKRRLSIYVKCREDIENGLMKYNNYYHTNHQRHHPNVRLELE